jgi:hypothetical protein
MQLSPAHENNLKLKTTHVHIVSQELQRENSSLSAYVAVSNMRLNAEDTIAFFRQHTKHCWARRHRWLSRGRSTKMKLTYHVE